MQDITRAAEQHPRGAALLLAGFLVSLLLLALPAPAAHAAASTRTVAAAPGAGGNAMLRPCRHAGAHRCRR